MTQIRSLLAGGPILCCALALPAVAQEADGESWVLDRVVVTGRRESITSPDTATATRTSTPLEKVPQSVQILTRTLIEEQDLQTASDALANISGVTPSSTMQTVLVAPLVRGFPSSYYFDGLPTYQLPASAADPATLVNVERIEVAKGPTATLYGGGSGAPLAGLINIVSRDPDPVYAAEFAVRGGSFSTWGTQGRVSAPLGDNAAVALAGMYEEGESFVRSVESERYALFPSLSWSISDRTRLSVRGQLTRLEQLEYSGLPVALIGRVHRNAFAGAENAPQTTIENEMVTAELRHEFSEDFGGSIAVRRYEGNFEEYSTYPIAPAAGTVYFFGSGQVPSEVEQTFISTSLWKRLAHAGTAHTLLAGVDYDDTDYFGAMGLDFAWGTIDYADPSTNAPFGTAPALSDLQNDDLGTVAFFVQDQIAIGDRLDITAGLRWSRLDVRSSYTSFDVPLVDTDESYSEVTPRIGLTYRVARGVSVFAGYSEGFKGVVAALGLTDPKPQTSSSVEAGMKFAAPMSGLTGTLAVYELKRQNVSTSDPSIPFRSIQTGEQRARGVEADLIYEPSRALSLLLSYAYTDAEVTRDNTIPVGDRLRDVPEHRGRLAVRYRVQSGSLTPLELGAGLTLTSERELTLPNTVAIDGLTLFDAQASWDFGSTSLSLSVVNLTDEDAFEPYQYFGGPYVIPTQQRSAFVTLRKQF